MPTILLVDDELEIVEYVRYVLEREGHTVLSATSAERALGVFHQHSGAIDVLLSDMTMKPMNGPQLATAIRAQRPSVAVVLMSGWSADDRPVHSAADRFLAKPFKQTELIEAINSVCAQSASRKHMCDSESAINEKKN